MRDILPLPNLPKRLELESPELAKTLDKIRKKLDDDEHAEFYWFAREYPKQ